MYNPPAPPPYTGPSLSGTWDKPRFHDRFYLRMSAGGGTLGTNASFGQDNGLDFETRGGCLSLDLAIGGTPVPGFVVGGNFAFQEAFKPHFTETLGEGETHTNTVFTLLGPFIDWFPDPRGGFHLGATFGYAYVAVVDQSGLADNTLRENGIGGAVRAGFDLWVSNQWALGLLGQFVGGQVWSGDTVVKRNDWVSSWALLFTALHH